jgi:hypothetical protein
MKYVAEERQTDLTVSQLVVELVVQQGSLLLGFPEEPEQLPEKNSDRLQGGAVQGGWLFDRREDMSQESFVGIDVAKESLQIAVTPGSRSWTLAYTDESVADLVQTLQTDRPKLVVMEATGGLEIPLAAALQSAGFSVAIVNPRHVRAFARATGRLSKNGCSRNQIKLSSVGKEFWQAT